MVGILGLTLEVCQIVEVWGLSLQEMCLLASGLVLRAEVLDLILQGSYLVTGVWSQASQVVYQTIVASDMFLLMFSLTAGAFGPLPQGLCPPSGVFEQESQKAALLAECLHLKSAAQGEARTHGSPQAPEGWGHMDHALCKIGDHPV